MKIASPAQMNEIDRICIEHYGIPGIVLMENAALKVVEETERTLGTLQDKCIGIFAGKGNNGGDALAVARHLYNRGAAVKLYMTAKRNDVKGDAAVNLSIIEKMEIGITVLDSSEQFHKACDELEQVELIIDGILGTGFKGEVKGAAAEAIALINRSRKPVLAIDIPSGLCGETGRVTGLCIKAVKTVTFGLAKTGLVIHPGCEYTGELVIVDIGLPRAAVDSLDIRSRLIEARQVRAMLPLRSRESNKGDYGRVLLISGSLGMTGAGCLAAKASLRTGAGLVYLGVPASLTGVYASVVAESITVPLEDHGTGVMSIDCADKIEDSLPKKTAVAVGPGMSTGADILKIVERVIRKCRVPLILDADALNAIAKDISVMEHVKACAVMTPHPGEMARLTGKTIEEVQQDRIGTARDFACKWKVTVVLKGARTVVALPDGYVYINTTGNPGMATAGTGDVLTGMIAAFAGQGIKPEDAAIAGVYLHGLAGDLAAVEKGEYGLIAGDVVEKIPEAIRRLMKSV